MGKIFMIDFLLLLFMVIITLNIGPKNIGKSETLINITNSLRK